MLASLTLLMPLVLAADAPAAAPPPMPRADVTPLFVSGVGGYGRYRIPVLYVTPKKTVLAFCEGRVKAAGLTGDIDLVLRRSTDGGRTWSPLQVVADDGPNTLGNPCPVVDSSTGVIWLPFTRSLGQDTETEIVEGQSDGRTQVWLTKSDDDGLTWAKPIDISNQATRPEWTWYGTGPGIGLQLPDGRLFIPSYHAVEKTGIYQVHSLYSDDHGKTWQIGGTLADETTEAQVALRKDGTLTINARNISPRDRAVLRNRVVAASRDGGATWTDVARDPTLTESSCEGSLLVYSGLGDGDKSRWLFSNPPGPGRNRLTLRLSYDEGRTWAVSKVIDPVSTEYSSLTRLPDGAIGLLYERSTTPGKYSVDLVLARLTIAELNPDETAAKQPGKSQPGKSPVKVFLLAGQSNMEGKGWASHIENQKDEPALAADFPTLKQDGKWVVRDDVWITYPTNAMPGGPKKGRLSVGFGTHRHEQFGDEIGPEFGIGHALGDALDHQVLLIKTAWGGKSVKKDFLPPTAGGPGEFYTAMVKHVREELAKLPETFPDYDGQGYEIAGLVWFQGFNDMVDGSQKTEKYVNYTQRLAALIRDLRKEFNLPNLPVVIGELGTGGLPSRGDFQAAQAAVAALPEFAGHVRFVKTCELYDAKAHELYVQNVWKDPVNKDKYYSVASDRPYHYLGSGKTYYLMGKAMGQAMAELTADRK